MDTAIPPLAIPEGYMQDSKGRLVPLSLVRPEDQLQDQLVRKLISFARELNAQIARFKGHLFDDVNAFMGLVAEKYDVKMGGQKGNLRLSSYDGLFKVEIVVSATITFGPQLQVAKELIDTCLTEWATGATAELRAIVDDTFRVDKAGGINREAILRLRRLAIDHEPWRAAMAAIDDSIQVEGSRTYMRFYNRARTTDPWTAITIDLASA